MLGFLAIVASQPVDETHIEVDPVALGKLIENEESTLDLLPSAFTGKIYEKLANKFYRKCLKKGGCRYGNN